MNKTKHPSNRAERLKLKVSKSKRVNQRVAQPKDHLRHSRRHDVEEVKAKEADDALREQVLGIEEEV